MSAKKKVNKTHLAQAISRKTGFPFTHVNKILLAFIEITNQSVMQKDLELHILGLGKFKRKKRIARTVGYNGAKVPAHYKLVFEAFPKNGKINLDE